MFAANNGSSGGGATHGSDRSLPENAVSSRMDNAETQCMNALKRLNLEPAQTIFVDKDQIARGTVRAGDQQVVVDSNIYGLRTQSVPVYQYHLEYMKFVGAELKECPLIFEDTFGRKTPDYTAYQNRQMHRHLLSAFVRKYPNVFGSDPDCFCYDYAATLFSLVELSAQELMLDGPETQAAIDRPYKVKLILKKPPDNVFDIRDIVKKSETNDVLDQPAHIIRFLELATSRYASQHTEDHVMYESKKTYFMDAAKHGFNSPNLNNGKYLAAGASKAVVCVEGPKNNGAPAVIIDSKKTPFYSSMNLLEMLCLALQVEPTIMVAPHHAEVIDKYVKRLEVFPIYGNRQHAAIILKSLCSQDAHQSMIEQEGRELSVAQYFQERYNITLQYPQWPLAYGAKKMKGIQPMYPLELLHVADYQRVGNGNISSTDIATIVKACAVNPCVKIQEIDSCFHSFSFGLDEFMKKAKLSVIDTPLKVEARVLKPPQIQYANGGLNPEGNGKWRLPRQAKYVKCSKVMVWCAIFLNVPRERMRLGDFQQFVEKYYHECQNRGLVLPPPAKIWEVACDTAPIEDAFKSASENECEFILIGHSDLDSKMHSVIKGMERKYSLISQCVKTKTINNVMKKSPLSLENIVAKTNVKLGGLNYTITLDNYAIDPTVLFIGLGMNHPAGGLGASAAPKPEETDGAGSNNSDTPTNFSMLGFSANDGKNSNEFIGNFFFQPQLRDEKLTVLDKLLVEILDRFKQNRQCVPSRVILFRSGCAEGAFGSVLRYEVPIIAAIVKKYAPGAPVSVVIPSKMHSVRFFKQHINPNDRSDAQNILPGTVIDSNAVSSVYSEYYLNSHLAIQGSAKTAKYTIIYTTEKDATLDMFERWTNALCYDFQIVTSPTSLPAPVYVANRYAERGRQIFNTFATSGKANLEGENGYGTGSGEGSNGSGSNGHGNNPENAPNPFYKKSLEFNFSRREFLRDKRVNA